MDQPERGRVAALAPSRPAASCAAPSRKSPPIAPGVARAGTHRTRARPARALSEPRGGDPAPTGPPPPPPRVALHRRRAPERPRSEILIDQDARVIDRIDAQVVFDPVVLAAVDREAVRAPRELRRVEPEDVVLVVDRRAVELHGPG